MDEVILSRIRQEAYDQGYQDGKVDGYNLAGTRMSSAKQERKKGRWMEENCRPRSIMFYCSECKRTSYDMQGRKGVPKRCRYNYCPYCGADMRKETEDAVD